MKTILKIVLTIYLFSTILVSLFSFIYLHFQTNVVFLAIIILAFFTSYLMSVWFRLLLKTKPYHGQYREQLLGFAKKHGFQLENIYVRDSKHSNACAFGLWNKKYITFNSFTLENHPWDEIEGVMAHELGHHANKGIYIYTTLASTILIVMSWINVAIYLYFNQDLTSLFLICIATSVFLLPVILFTSRTMEGFADKYAKKILKDPSSLGRFFERMLENEKKLGEKVPKNPAWFIKIFFTHPWFDDRIKLMKNNN